jgi:Spx/MgsR family transcriptional regulator
MTMKVYGIKNCNTMKKTFDYLNENGVSYEFIDYKKQKPNSELLNSFLQKTSLETLVNKQGTTYRKMDESQKVALNSEDTAIPILVENSSMIKRPVIVYPNGGLTLGFDPKEIGDRL